MSHIRVLEGDFSIPQGRFAIVAGRFNGFIVEPLTLGALDAFKRHGVSEASIDLIKVPGAWEIAQAARKLAASDRYAGIVALGAVIRGSTAHFDYVAGECAKGLAQVGLHSDVPVIFGVLTTDTIEQAIERAGTKAGNKGAEAAITVIEMANLYRQLDERS